MALKYIFVPAAVVLRHRTDALEFGFNLGNQVTVEIEGLHCPGFTLMAQLPIIDTLYQRWGLHTSHSRTVGEVTVDIAVATCDAHVLFGDDHPAVEKIEAVSGELETTLRVFGERLGLSEVGLEFIASSNEFTPPKQPRDGRLTFVIGSGPVGLTHTQKVSTICGVYLSEEEGNTLELRSYTSGYDGLIHDDDEHIVAQIVGSTYYLTLPSRAGRFATLYSKEHGAGLFNKAINLAWNRRGSAANTPPRHELTDAATFAKEIIRIDTNTLENHQLNLKAVRKEIEDLELKLRSELILLRTLTTAGNALEANITDLGRYERLVASFDRIATHHLVERISSLEDERGIEIWTTPVVIEHDGKKFGPLGPYVITITTYGSMFIRCRDYPYEDKYVHPHVPLSTGEACLGNATRTINDALIGDNPVHGVEMVLDWLENGYDHTIAALKVTQWPEIKEPT